MSALNIPCVYLSGATPHSAIIPAVELADYFNTTSMLVKAREEAEAIRQQARASLADAQRDAQQIRDEAHHQGLADAASELASLRTTLIDETLEWLVAETELETTIAQHLDTRLRVLVGAVLEEFIGEQDATELIIRRVQQRLMHFLSDEAITLRVSTSSETTAKDTFSSYSQVRVITDSALKNTQALLETHLFTLQIDLDLHLQSLLSRLRQASREELTDDQQDRLRKSQASAGDSKYATTATDQRNANFPLAISH
ncbi:hypothetical protein [Pseudomonas sp. 6D_7.1_Bac1]|jgi:hypothetical protein|uniref:hypothetical protein n=1 Tax=Pseudomonas sp. 6D_7.1_Bac1 TaxID=2971615 RepID=UPI0021C8F572|nr:hypothetical protein [Pseudomonas sp. 6D_7.1_Bac1]MCU1748812.1 hypothetical protein [Pseudomonas sp. 6D_7.1_Bac1]